MTLEFQQLLADENLEADYRDLVRLAIREDFADVGDPTTDALVPKDAVGRCLLRSREDGIAAGLVTLSWLQDEIDFDLEFEASMEDGCRVTAGETVVEIRGRSRDILSSERIILNTLCRMFGIATWTNQFVAAVSGTNARVYDTRKTTLGWRRLDKYAVRCGGGTNHRSGLYDAYLIKDNHLALAGENSAIAASEGVRRAKTHREEATGSGSHARIVEIEVDTLQQYRDAIVSSPDIIMLDNFSLEDMREAVDLRNASGSKVQLEASGNVKLDTIGSIARTGVDRISSGALTHAARWLDLGLDWQE